MNTQFHPILLYILLLSLLACRPEEAEQEQETAGAALEWWAAARSYPDGKIRSDSWYRGFQQLRAQPAMRGELPDWQPLGPLNVGGRTLCLAFHPKNPELIFAGSASGGLWKTTTAGKGAQAWTYVPTSFPVLGVGAIAIDSGNPDVMYIGTGEVYNYRAAFPGVGVRFTRGSYGIGILKSTDGGKSWRLSLDWSQTELRGVWDILINPKNPRTVYAATTEGVFRSFDAGQSWALIHNKAMATDLAAHPSDTSVLLVAHGNLNSPDRGVYRSADAGKTFQLVQGLPSDYRGKTHLAISPSNPKIVYASVADEESGRGLFRSDDGGAQWRLVNPQDVPLWQGWFSHDLAVHPGNPNTLVYAGIDVHVSTDGGQTLEQRSYWSKWELGRAIPPGDPEGPPDYVHSDIHGVYYQPGFENRIFLATDGGVFASENGGTVWTSRNGGYQTTQFYAEFSSSLINATVALGGLQDNATVIHTGNGVWARVIGGDGGSTAIYTNSDRIFFASSQFLNLRRSSDGGRTFEGISITSAAGERRSFIAPYRLAPSQPDWIYAGAQRLHVSTNRGRNWRPTGDSPVDRGNPLLAMAVDPQDPRQIFVSSAPLQASPASVLRSLNGGESWERLSGLPDRYAMDIVFHPGYPDTLFIAFAGFGTPHLYRSRDGGASWSPLTNNLPDVPASAVVVDPLNPAHVYLGNDLGVFFSADGGDSWRFHAQGLPDAVMVMDLSISPVNRRLRAATHGNGVFEVNLLPPGTSPAQLGDPLRIVVSPNPFQNQLRFELDFGEPVVFSLHLYNAKGQRLQTLEQNRAFNSRFSGEYELGHLPQGVYFYEISGRRGANGEAFSRGGRLVHSP